MTDALGGGLGIALAVMTVAWIASVLRANASYVDRAWGVTVVAVAWGYLVLSSETSSRALLATGLATLWGVRLVAHLTASEWGAGESWRHRGMRVANPSTFTVRSLLFLFWPQAVAAVATSLPLLAVNRAGQRGLAVLDVLGAAVCLAGIAIEAVSDNQLHRFRRVARRSAHDVLAQGLWRYSRHPNYFGDALAWWGLGVLGVASGRPWSLLGPAGMTVVLVLGSGVRSMDRHMHDTRGSAYADYARRTSAFVPLPPRRDRHPRLTTSAGAGSSR